MKTKRTTYRTSRKFPGVEWADAPEMFIAVDPERCTGCARCLNVCLAHCFVIKQKKSHVKSLELCMECGSCWYVCPEGAISFSWPRGGTGFRTQWG